MLDKGHTNKIAQIVNGVGPAGVENLKPQKDSGVPASRANGRERRPEPKPTARHAN
jgi:hypothetical protein